MAVVHMCCVIAMFEMKNREGCPKISVAHNVMEKEEEEEREDR